MTKIGMTFLITSMLALNVQASVIKEIEKNNSFGAAQSLENGFSNANKWRVENSGLEDWEWVSVNGKGNGTYDYYLFEANSGQDFIFDIDWGISGKRTSIDTELGLWALDGLLLHEQDNCYSEQGLVNYCNTSSNGPDKGSLSTLDPMFSWTFEDSGLYVLGVGKFNTFANSEGFGFDPAGGKPERGERYKLNVSRNLAYQTQAILISEPATLAIFSIGLIGIGAVRAQKRRKSK